MMSSSDKLSTETSVTRRCKLTSQSHHPGKRLNHLCVEDETDPSALASGCPTESTDIDNANFYRTRPTLAEEYGDHNRTSGRHPLHTRHSYMQDELRDGELSIYRWKIVVLQVEISNSISFSQITTMKKATLSNMFPRDQKVRLLHAKSGRKKQAKVEQEHGKTQ